MNPAMTPALTAAQRQVVAHRGGAVVVRGGPGTGKTTALVRRYQRLAVEHGAQRALVLARHRPAADRFRHAVLPHLRGGFESLSITTAWGLGFDLLRRHGRAPRLLTSSEQWALVRELLSSEAGDRTRWPGLHPFVASRAFADEVVAALAHVQSLGHGPEDVRAVAQQDGDAGARWSELAAFLERYRTALHARGLVDGGGVVAEACSLLRAPGVMKTERARHPHLLVDDYEAATPAALQLLGLLAGPGSDLALAGDPDHAAHGPCPALAGVQPAAEVTLDVPFRTPGQPVLVRCGHPSLEPEAVAGELLEAHHGGVAWGDMAVLVRNIGGRPRSSRAEAVTRALVRHGIPVTTPARPVLDEPSVRGLVDLLRWVNGDAGALERLLASPLTDLDPSRARRLRQAAKASGTALEDQPALARLVAVRDSLSDRAASDDVAQLAHRAFRLGLFHLVHEPAEHTAADEERALDAVVAFLDGVTRFAERNPGTKLDAYLTVLDAPWGGPEPWQPARSLPDSVTVTSIAASAGHEWHTVVVAGCLEGELPRVSDGIRFFDTALLRGSTVPPVEERRRASVAEERRLFTMARSRACGALVATAAPEPGMMLSRFVEGWEERPPALWEEEGPSPPALAPTAGVTPIWPRSGQSLSATQLDTYEDCPLKHAYRYALGVRGDTGVHASLGNLVHRVLERFRDPAGPVPAAERSLERLHQVAEEHWHDDVAPYRPQLEEARRDLFEMLDQWWQHEGGVGGGPAVLATEHRFDVDVGPHQLTGRIDRVDRSTDGGGLRVVDYKTGKTRPKPADVADDLQLAAYHLGASRDPGLASWGPVRELRLLHLRTMTVFEQEITDHHAQATEERIVATAARIATEDMTPDVDADCDHCEVRRLCPLWPEGREVGQP